ncbi:hypothetical protein GCM10022222_47320 [Amycolatopsis ultiminotia]|uniref:Uncharacterized protein n=1 Tax=Amycolatopsis ultiminotia TaxID=543629 RepID=A0ABP6X045_9PSEU
MELPWEPGRAEAGLVWDRGRGRAAEAGLAWDQGRGGLALIWGGAGAGLSEIGADLGQSRCLLKAGLARVGAVLTRGWRRTKAGLAP